MSIRFVYEGFEGFQAVYEDSYGGFEYDFTTAPSEVFDTMIAVHQFLYPEYSKDMPNTYKEFCESSDHSPRELVSEYELFEVIDHHTHHRYAEAEFKIILKIKKKEFKKIAKNKELAQMIQNSGIKVVKRKTIEVEMDWDLDNHGEYVKNEDGTYSFVVPD